MTIKEIRDTIGDLNYRLKEMTDPPSSGGHEPDSACAWPTGTGDSPLGEQCRVHDYGQIMAAMVALDAATSALFGSFRFETNR
jgi:hypothetical protein